MTSVSDEKWRTFNFFLVQGTHGSQMGPDPKDELDDPDTESPGRPVFSGLQVPGEPGHFLARTSFTVPL
jgi:hypothetical protein